MPNNSKRSHRIQMSEFFHIQQFAERVEKSFDELRQLCEGIDNSHPLSY